MLMSGTSESKPGVSLVKQYALLITSNNIATLI